MADLSEVRGTKARAKGQVRAGNGRLSIVTPIDQTIDDEPMLSVSSPAMSTARSPVFALSQSASSSYQQGSGVISDVGAALRSEPEVFSPLSSTSVAVQKQFKPSGTSQFS